MDDVFDFDEEVEAILLTGGELGSVVGLLAEQRRRAVPPLFPRSLHAATDGFCVAFAPACGHATHPR